MIVCLVKHAILPVQAARLMEDYTYGRDYIDPKHVADGGVTRDHVRKWKVLQELQVIVCTTMQLWVFYVPSYKIVPSIEELLL